MTTPRIAITIDLGTAPVSCTAADLEATFAWLLAEMRSVAKVLRPDERELLRAIMSHTGPPLTVRALLPGVAREGEAHKTLRRLRATQFVYPERTGRWEPAEPVAVTPFARVVWEQLGEAGIFPPGHPVALARTPPPRPAPVTWDNLLECIRDRQQGSASGGAAPARAENARAADAPSAGGKATS